MKVNLMLGGVPPKYVDDALEWIGVDSGTNYLMGQGICPKYIIGDLDSVNSEYLKDYSGQVIKKMNQDMTDTEYALEKIFDIYEDVEEINIYGATGRRQDHFFANILLLNNCKYENKLIKIIDDNNIIYIVNAGEAIIKKIEGYKYISFVPLQKETVVSILGAKYDVQKYLLSVDRANATSNEFSSNEIHFITNKKCLVIYSKDK